MFHLRGRGKRACFMLDVEKIVCFIRGRGERGRSMRHLGIIRGVFHARSKAKKRLVIC